MLSYFSSVFSNCFPPPLTIPTSAPSSTRVSMQLKIKPTALSDATSAGISCITQTYQGPINSAEQVLSSEEEKVQSVQKLIITDHWNEHKPTELSQKEVYYFSSFDNSSGEEGTPIEPALARKILQEAQKGPIDTIYKRAHEKFTEERSQSIPASLTSVKRTDISDDWTDLSKA